MIGVFIGKRGRVCDRTISAATRQSTFAAISANKAINANSTNSTMDLFRRRRSLGLWRFSPEEVAWFEEDFR